MQNIHRQILRLANPLLKNSMDHLEWNNKIIDGKKISKNIQKNLKLSIQTMKEKFNLRSPKLAIILVGNNQASLSYVRRKKQGCKLVGIDDQIFHFNEETSQEEIINVIKFLNKSPKYDSVLVQLPLPQHLNKNEIIYTIDPSKEVDCFHQITNCHDQIQKQNKNQIFPCTPTAIMHILEGLNINLKNQHICIIGRGKLVGFPLSLMLLQKQANVLLLNYHDKDNLEYHVKQADIVVSAVGQRHLIKGEWIKPNSVVIDVGISKGIPDVDKTKIVGDIEISEAIKYAKYITPVPGGVGPLTVSMLLTNVVSQWENNYCQVQLVKKRMEP